jgi:hypothetical protein
VAWIANIYRLCMEPYFLFQYANHADVETRCARLADLLCSDLLRSIFHGATYQVLFNGMSAIHSHTYYQHEESTGCNGKHTHIFMFWSSVTEDPYDFYCVTRFLCSVFHGAIYEVLDNGLQAMKRYTTDCKQRCVTEQNLSNTFAYVLSA